MFPGFRVKSPAPALPVSDVGKTARTSKRAVSAGQTTKAAASTEAAATAGLAQRRVVRTAASSALGSTFPASSPAARPRASARLPETPPPRSISKTVLNRSSISGWRISIQRAT